MDQEERNQGVLMISVLLTILYVTTLAIIGAQDGILFALLVSTIAYTTMRFTTGLYYKLVGLGLLGTCYVVALVVGVITGNNVLDILSALIPLMLGILGFQHEAWFGQPT
jgi:hypothetical protein